MNLIRKFAVTSLLLGAVIGCANEEDASPKPGGPMTPPPGETPQAKPGPKAEPAKTTPSKEMVPPPAKEDTKKAAEPPKLEEPKQTNKSDASPTKLTEEELAAIKELPSAEQAVAIKQAVCPVSNHHLGSMDKPVKVTAEGRTFYLCCGGCEEDLKANPKATIAKLDQASKK